MSNQIVNDIGRWSQERIAQWFDDSVDRYRMADLSQREADCCTVATLMTTLAIVLAQSSASPEECGRKLMEAVRSMRKLEHKGHA
jgi:hypothetical protein